MKKEKELKVAESWLDEECVGKGGGGELRFGLVVGERVWSTLKCVFQPKQQGSEWM
jgi:hypothetical protein